MIRWITDRLGTSSWDYAQSTSGYHLVDVRELVDKRGNAAESIKPKIAEAVEHLNRNEKVVICCDYGISRSNSIAVGVLSEHEGIPIDEAIRRILDQTGENGIKIEVLDAVRQVIEGPAKIPPTNQSILVTGASGFIGSSIVQKLRANGQVVIAPSHSDLDLVQDSVRLDMLVKQHNVQKIVHLAAPRIYTTNGSLGDTLVMLKNILDVSIQNNSKFYYLSGWEIYSGYKAQQLFADEGLPARPGTTYGQAKYLSETLIHHYAQQYGLEHLILRSSPVYGVQSDRPKFIWNFLSKARDDQEIVTHQYLNGFPALDLLHIDDLQAAVITVLNTDVTGQFNIGTGVGITTTDVARILIEKTGSKSKIRHLSIEDHVGNIVMDHTRFTQIFEWNPKINISQGLDQYIQVAISKSGDKEHD